jgi:hypothetical protein
LGEIQFEKKKNGGKTKWTEGQGIYRTLGWRRDFPRVYGEPLRELGTGEGCFKTLQEICENVLAGSA